MISLIEKYCIFVEDCLNIIKMSFGFWGLWHGCSLSPSLLNIVECVSLEWMKACRRVVVPVDETFLFTLIFAFDQMLTAQNEFSLGFLKIHTG
jgi:hypothetical protein